MQFVKALELCANDCAKHSLETYDKINNIQKQIDMAHERIRNGTQNRLRAEANIADYKADIEEAEQDLKQFLADRVKEPLATFDRICTLKFEDVDQTLANILPHIDLTEDELRKLLVDRIEADRYTEFRVAASCARDRGIKVSDPYPVTRKEIEKACEMIKGYSTAVAMDNDTRYPVKLDGKRAKAGERAYVGNLGALLAKVSDQITKVSRTSTLLRIDGTVDSEAA